MNIPQHIKDNYNYYLEHDKFMPNNKLRPSEKQSIIDAVNIVRNKEDYDWAKELI